MYLKKNTPEEILESIRLRMIYSTSKTLNENLKVIKEQASDENEDILKLIAKGAAGSGGFGTDEDSLIMAVEKLKDGNHFNQINAEMAKTPKRFGNYSSIIKLLQGEMEMDDIRTVGEIKNILAKKGINLSITDKDGYYNPKQITVLVNSKPTPSPTPPPKTSPDPVKKKYRYCKSLPFKQNCNNRLIIEVQSCLGLPKKYQTGNFGPITLKSLNERLKSLGKAETSEITEDVYRIIIQNCNGSSDVEPSKRTTEPVQLDGPKRPSVSLGDNLPTTINAGPKLSAPNVSGEQLFKAYLDLKDLYKRGDDWVFKGDNMTRDNLDKVSQYLRDQGYRTLEKGDKRYGEKFVWKR